MSTSSEVNPLTFVQFYSALGAFTYGFVRNSTTMGVTNFQSFFDKALESPISFTFDNALWGGFGTVIISGFVRNFIPGDTLQIAYGTLLFASAFHTLNK